MFPGIGAPPAVLPDWEAGEREDEAALNTDAVAALPVRAVDRRISTADPKVTSRTVALLAIIES
ncbi:MAG: hypothetical protein ACXVBW_09865 [Bdellovibrionota bacterium]